MKARLTGFLMAAIFPALFIGCSYIPEISCHETNLNLRVENCLGTQADISASPDDDTVPYTFGIREAKVLDESIAKIGEEQLMLNFMDTLRMSYEYFRSIWMEQEPQPNYVATMFDLAIYYTGVSSHATLLKPETDYYVTGFCINPNTNKPMGQLQKVKFRTGKILPARSNMKLLYMVRDVDELCYCYIKPILEGKVCKDLYLVDIVDDETLYAAPYYGDIEKYGIEAVYMPLVETGLIDTYLKSDISRFRAFLEEGHCYTIFGCAYNINNAHELFTLHFKYEKGLYIKYTNDQLDGPLRR